MMKKRKIEENGCQNKIVIELYKVQFPSSDV